MHGGLSSGQAGIYGFAGSFLGFGGSYILSELEHRRAIKSLQREKEIEERKEQFLKDKEVYGDASYDMVHKDYKSSWIPAWWPIQSLPDEEYKKMLEDKQRILNSRLRHKDSSG